MSSSTQSPRPSSPIAARRPSGRRAYSHASRVSAATDDATDDGSEATAPAQTIRDVSQAFRSGRPSPYHMAVVTLLGSLASGMPLASMFKVYTYIMCEVYDPSIRNEPLSHKSSRLVVAARNMLAPASASASATAAMLKLPPAPELPNPPRCSLPWVQKSTSSYSAAMVTVGALLGLMTLSRASHLSRRFGRRPLLLIAHVVIALAILVFRVAVVLPPVAGAVVLYAAVVISEASAGAPLRIAIQNYVVDTTSEAQRAGALSFIEGFGQIGAFPSSALGGLLASLTNEFFAPFYADCALMILAVAYILVIVPESKPGAEHTFVDQWIHSDELEADAQSQSSGTHPDNAGESAEQNHSNLTWSSCHTDRDSSKLKWRSRLRKLNFLRPLAIFAPRRRHFSPTTEHDVMHAPLDTADHDQRPAPGQQAELSTAVHKVQSRMDFRLLNLAAVVVFEETYQAFMVPLLLLYNSERFGFDVLQNGYLVSVLQSTRALFLTAIFPPGVALARRYVTKLAVARRRKQVRKLKQKAQAQNHARTPGDAGTAANDERAPLVRGTSSKYGSVDARDYGKQPSSAGAEGSVQARPARRRPSYRSAAALGSLKANKRTSMASQISVGSNNWETHSIFTHSPSDLIKRIQRGKLDISIMVASYTLATASFLVMASSAKAPTTSSGDGDGKMWWSSAWIPLVLAVVLLQISAGSTSVRTALVVNAVSEDDQTKALAAHQILVTTVAAVVPLLTSFVYGVALERGHPELVWLFKALFAALAAVGALGLFWSHRGFYEKAHDEDEDSHSDDDESHT